MAGQWRDPSTDKHNADHRLHLFLRHGARTVPRWMPLVLSRPRSIDQSLHVSSFRPIFNLVETYLQLGPSLCSFGVEPRHQRRCIGVGSVTTQKGFYGIALSLMTFKHRGCRQRWETTRDS